MSLAFRTARIFWQKKNVKWSAVRPVPAPAGHFRQLADHGFCHRENKQNNIISLHRTTSGKTPRPRYPRYGVWRATVRQLADQRHIPSNVGNNIGKICNWFIFDVNLHQNIIKWQGKVFLLQNQMMSG